MKRRMLCVMMVLTALTAGAGTTNYVALSGNGNDGSDWANAFTNLRDAIAASSGGDTILVKTGSYSVVSELYIGQGTNLTIRGGYEGGTPLPGPRSDVPALTMFDAGGAGRVFQVVSNTFSIEGMTLRGGAGAHGGAFYLQYATSTVVNCVLRDNNVGSTYYGAGAYVNRGSAVFDGCVLRDNSAKRGAGVYATYATVHLRNSTIEGNSRDGESDGYDCTLGFMYSGNHSVSNACLPATRADP